MSYSRQVDTLDGEREQEMVEIPTRDFGPVNPYSSAYESSSAASGFVTQPTMVQMPSEFYEQHQPPMSVPLVSPEVIDPTASCCGRYSLLLWGSRTRQILSGSVTLLMIIGALLITFAPLQCSSDCSEIPCAGDDGNTYDCSCATECRVKSSYAAGGRTGIVFCLLCISYFAFYAIWAIFQRSSASRIQPQHLPVPTAPR